MGVRGRRPPGWCATMTRMTDKRGITLFRGSHDAVVYRGDADDWAERRAQITG